MINNRIANKYPNVNGETSYNMRNGASSLPNTVCHLIVRQEIA